MRKKLLIPTLALMLLAVLFSLKMPVSAKTDSGYELKAEVGFDGNYSSYRLTPVWVDITNRDEDFVGTVEVLYRDDSSRVVSYKKDLVLAAGESKRVLFEIKLPLNSSTMNVRLMNRENKKLANIILKPTANISWGLPIFGVLSGKSTTVYQYGSTDMNLIALNTEDLEEADALSMLDVILVDQYDLGGLSSSKIKVLEDWVKAGGTLVLGTGSYYNETLTSFSPDFLSGTIGDLTEWSYSYGESSQEDLTYCPLKLENAESILNISGTDLIWRVDSGEGNILVSALCFELPSWLWGNVGTELYTAIENNLSDVNKERLQEENQNGYVYYLENALGIGGPDQLPNMILYVLILCVYVILVGPVLYLILRKLDKRHYLWFLVPVASLVFTVTVIFAGSGTRIKEPYMNYITFLNYNGKENAAGPAEKTYFQLTAPFNRDYHVVIDKQYRISQMRMDRYGGSYGQEEYKDYEIALYQTGESTDIELNDPSAFQAFSFVAEGNAKTEGTYEALLKVREDGSVAGTFSNNLGYDLEKLLLMHEGLVVLLGDVADGGTVEIDSNQMDSWYCGTDSYSFWNGGALEQIFGYNYNAADQARKYYALSYYLNNYSSRNSGTYLVGLSDFVNGETLMTDCELKNYGVTLSILRADGVYSRDYVYDIEEFTSFIIKGGYDGGWNRYMSESVLEIEYQFTEEFKPARIFYSELLNPECQGRNWDYFPGNIYFFNYETGEYDRIFSSGKAADFDELKPYLTENGKLTVKYEVEQNQFYSERYNITVPILSVAREVTSDGTN